MTPRLPNPSVEIDDSFLVLEKNADEEEHYAPCGMPTAWSPKKGGQIFLDLTPLSSPIFPAVPKQFVIDMPPES